MLDTCIFAGASIIGQAHVESALNNQDSYIIKKFSFGIVMAAADGLGSKKHSDIGSKAACRAICEAARIWSRKQNAPIEQLIRLIHNLWQINIYPYNKEECGTTCLFAIYLFQGKLIMGQLGDGILGYIKDDKFYILSEKEEEFSNITNSMHTVKSVREWKYICEEIGKSPFSVILATDGVSEDLHMEKREAFLKYLVDKIKGASNMRKRNSELKAVLNSWITKYSSDDKTIIVFDREVTAYE